MRKDELRQYVIIATGLLFGCMTAMGAHGLIIA